jgi:phosphate starvation-inducible PhoH-like protein
MKMFLTRIGFGSKAVVTGDITQIDLPAGKVSGLVESIDIISDIPGIVYIYLDQTDVIRHRLVQSIIRAYERHQNGKNRVNPNGVRASVPGARDDKREPP